MTYVVVNPEGKNPKTIWEGYLDTVPRADEYVGVYKVKFISHRPDLNRVIARVVWV